MHDGPVWPLYLKPVNRPLIANWKFMPEFPDHGDRMGECMQDSHTYKEILQLCSRMQRLWNEGLAILEPLVDVFGDDPDRMLEINNARALGLLFESGYDILRFYYLRELLADATGPEALTYLGRMKNLVRREMDIGVQLAEYCVLDPALGFNSEHEGYRFSPERLRGRIGQLQALQDGDFPEIEQRLRQGRRPFPQYTGHEPDRTGYVCQQVASDGDQPLFVDWNQVGESGALIANDAREGEDRAYFKACHDGSYLYIAVFTEEEAPLAIVLFSERLWPDRTYVSDPGDDSPWMRRPARYWWPYQDKEYPERRVLRKAGRCVVTIRFALDELRPEHIRLEPLRVNVKRMGKRPADWVRRESAAPRLAQSSVNPDEYGWFTFVGRPR